MGFTIQSASNYTSLSIIPKPQALPITHPPISSVTVQQSISLTPEEIGKHATSTDCWIIIDTQVYDVTTYLSRHPGGAFRIIPYCGKDATEAYATKDGRGSHSPRADQQLGSLSLGSLHTTIQIPSVKPN